jgi:class 3 adenylate cyclase
MASRSNSANSSMISATVWNAGVLVQVRVGLNSGEVVVRSIGSDLRTDYTAVGQTTHLAARMEQGADPGTILLAPESARRLTYWRLLNML